VAPGFVGSHSIDVLLDARPPGPPARRGLNRIAPHGLAVVEYVVSDITGTRAVTER